MDLQKLLLQILPFFVLVLSSSAYYSLTASGKIFSLLESSGDLLGEAEQARLDQLLENGRRYHNYAYLVAGILVAISGLANFQGFAAPFGELTFPRIQTAIGLQLLVILLLTVSDRFYLMSFPWLRLDPRRPPFSWMVIGIKGEGKALTSLLFWLPIFVSSFAAAILLSDLPQQNGVLAFGTLAFSGFGLAVLPRTIYYWTYHISERMDHRGGRVTLSVYLLYWYRVGRQLIYGLFIISPVIFAIPQWRDSELKYVFVYGIVGFAVAYVIRMICGIKAIYRLIDRIGLRIGFPVSSTHY